MKKGIIAVWLALAPFSSWADIKEVTLLHTNDIESVYEPVEAYWDPHLDYIGGMPYLATLIHQIRAEEPISFLFDSGDIFTGALSKKTLGKLAFDIYSAIGYDTITLGNHEFEYGWQALRDTMPRASFPTLNANIVYEGTDIPFAQPYTIVEKSGVRIGVIGVMGIDAFNNTIWKGNRQGLEILDPVETLQHWVDRLRPEVDMIVALTHQNRTAPMQTDKEADPEVQRGFDEDYAMAGQVKGIDVIFGGHSDHGLWQPVVHPETGTVIGLTFGQGKYLGQTKFRIDTDTGEVEFLEGKLIPVASSNLERNKQVELLIETARSQHPELKESIATLDKTAHRRYYRESNIGNLVADIMREQGRADVGMISSGSLRVDLNSGPVTAEQVMDLFPFTDTLTVIALSGSQLKSLLEYGYTLPYGLAQFSGIVATYDSRKPEGKRLLSLMINGQPVEDDKEYKVATYSFAASGGDGYKIFEQGKKLSDEGSVTQILIEAFRQRGTIQVPEVGRQVDVARTLS